MEEMKRQIVFTLALFCIIQLNAELTEGSREGSTPANDSYSGLCVDIPEFREINGGTVFKVTYDENCPLGLQGAFNYACRIWEENLLTCLPINISVKVEKIRSTGQDKVLSKVKYRVIDFEDPRDNMLSTLSSRVKYTILQEYHSGNYVHFADEIDDAGFFEKSDIEITYNEDCLDEFSYNMESLPEYGYYDFVTLALRDIARGLGFGHNIYANPADQKIRFPVGRLTHYENIIKDAIGDDPYAAYQNSTKGELNIDINALWGDSYGTLKLYAPGTWSDGLSLQYFIPDDAKPISRLLSYDFSKGTVIRDITDDYDTLLPQALGWQYDVFTGGSSSSHGESGSNEIVLPYKGTFSLPSGELKETATCYLPQDGASANTLSSTNSYFNMDDYCEPYNFFYGGPDDSGSAFAIAVLKKDGTWDTVYTLLYHYDGGALNFDNMPLHYDIEDYARTCDGLLRYRFTNWSFSLSSLGPVRSYGVKYYAREYTPQKAAIKYNGLHETQNFSRTANTEDYWVDIEIGIKNLEGTTRVVVEQLEEGELLPFSYDVEDFKRGYFVATVDKDYSTQFTVISYNENGTTRSNTITVPPVSEMDNASNIDFDILADKILVNIDEIRDRRISYRIDPLLPSTTGVATTNLNADGVIDISNLCSGMYVLTVYEDGNRSCSEKFIH